METRAEICGPGWLILTHTHVELQVRDPHHPGAWPLQRQRVCHGSGERKGGASWMGESRVLPKLPKDPPKMGLLVERARFSL